MNTQLEEKQFTKNKSEVKYTLSDFKLSIMYPEHLIIGLDSLDVGEFIDYAGKRYTRIV